MTKINQTEDSPARVLGHPLFRGAPPAIARLLLRDAALLHVEDGTALFREGEDALEYLYVLSGGIEVLRHTQDGQERVFHIFRVGQVLAETAMFMTHERYPMHARAHGDAIVVCLKRAGLQAACRAWPELSMRLLTRLSDRVYRRVNQVEWFSDSTAAQRLADYLLRLRPGEEMAVRLPLTQRQLATHLGVRAETLSRLLADWVAQGRITGARRDWILCDPAFLDDLAQPVRRSF
ncbi:MAG: Crp/Fnr family transcriptional regulator [Castellaniella sp.]|uniref:Crp/Fnr family transcriptional regulator n=1 Tax=Castellaniella sp. TaxID=1955812 RepID=UPI003A898C89